MKINVMKKIIISLVAILLCCSSMVSINAKEPLSSKYEGEDAIETFMEMQDEITDSMTVSEGKYSYNYEIIKSIVYGFDFTNVNEKLGTDYTNESFLNLAINDIENTEITTNSEDSVCTIGAGMCKENWTSSGWNYERAAMDDNNTTGTISDCKNWAAALLASGTIGGATASVAPLAFILISASALGVAWYTMVGNSLESKQKQADKCGVVMDINKYTYQYSIWTQPEF